MNALALGIVVAAVLAAAPSSGDTVGHGPRFLFCPGYRARDSAPGAVNNRKVDPLWLLQNEDEWLPLRSDKSAGAEDQRGRGKFFGCFIYHFAAFSHYVLDFFFPYYGYPGYPYYRVALEPDPESGSSPWSDTKSGANLSS